jgi:NAD-dependent deacetylase
MKDLIEQIKKSQHCTAFTGAGVSTFSGIRDFRGKNGLYNDEDADKIFDLNYFMQDPSFYYRKTKNFIYDFKGKTPGIIHKLLADLETAGLMKAVITQNIDLLHQKAGSTDVVEVHGSPMVHRCLSCDKTWSFNIIADIVQREELPLCDVCGGIIKPDITFFGESLPAGAIERAFELASGSELMLVLGSSLVVQPAASIPLKTIRNGGKIVIVNDMETPIDNYAWKTFSDLEAFSVELKKGLL